MDNVVIYSAIFGGYDAVVEPTVDVPCKMVLFTDSDVKSENWEVRKVPGLYSDPTRTARKYKILPHRFFPEYKYSIWIDGNFKIINSEITKLLEYLESATFATYDHMQCFDKRNCIYDEANIILHFGKKNNGNYKDNPKLIIDQARRYQNDGYPAHNGLISSGVIVRQHNDASVKDAMEHWWTELKYGSKRDQLSFNYVAWRTKFPFNYIKGDIRDNEFVKHLGPHKGRK